MTKTDKEESTTEDQDSHLRRAHLRSREVPITTTRSASTLHTRNPGTGFHPWPTG